MLSNTSHRLLCSILSLASCLLLTTHGAKADGGAASLLPPLEQSSPTPVSNVKESKGNNRPSDEKAFEADKHTKDSSGAGGEELGTDNQKPPDRSGQQMGQSVHSSSTGQQIKEKNESSTKTKPSSAVVKGKGLSICAMVSAFGSTVESKPFLEQSPRVGTANDVEHNLGSIGNALVPAGLDLGASGQSAHGSSVAASQLIPVASQEAGIEAAIADSFAQKVPNPRGWSKVAKGVLQSQNAQNSDNQANCAQQNTENAFTQMKVPLINVANEDAAVPCSSSQPFKEESNVIWMVQQMYKKCYIPMAVLFLLPGAVLTQVKSLIAFGILNIQDDDTASPFMGIFRAIMAIFLIPATQLAVSYSIDIGNAMTDPVAKRVQVETLMNWVKEQAYSSDPKNNDGCIKNVSANQGKLMGTSAKSVVQERQNDLNVTVQNMFNTINAMLSQGLEVLNGFQLVMMCYLFLMGPIAAALYAWPAAVGRDLFKRAFSSWLDGVIVLSLWKFWWCIVLMCMAIRLQSGIDPTSHYEMYYYTAFMGILVMVPFQPFEFRPGEVVSTVLDKAQQGGGGGGGTGGAGKGGSKGKGGNPQGGKDTGANAPAAGGEDPSGSHGPAGSHY